jgi:predicted lipoprotein with Yx(FWY)xxD motif
MKKLALLVSVLALAGSAFALQVATAHNAHSATVKRATLKLRSGTPGRFVVDGRGRTLYEFEKDSSRRSACSGACAHNWPPVLTSRRPAVGAGLSASKAGTIRRANGRLQATYGGHPLYRFVGDSAPGDTNGQDVNAFGAKWYVVAASGAKIDPDDAPKPADDSGSTGYGY